MNERNKLSEIALLFLKLGTISFGGPAAHIMMMEDEVVKKRKWITHEHFLDLIGATNLIPGPNSTEMAMHCGHERAGWKGLIVAGICFILPAVIITSILAWFYLSYGHLPKVAPFLYGIKPAVIAIILSALIPLGKKALKTVELGVLGAVVLIACLLGFNEVLALFTAGFAGIIWQWTKSKNKTTNSFFPLILLQATGISALKIFWSFLKTGAILYGSGYALFAFLDAEMVSQGWLSRQALIDAVAIGQLTPGPVLSTATFIGWQLGGLGGAVAATIGIFLPSFLFVAILNPLIPALRKSKVMSAFLDAVNVASVAIILNVWILMCRDSLTDWRTLIIALVCLIIIFVFKKTNAAFIVAGSAILGYILTLF